MCTLTDKMPLAGVLRQSASTKTLDGEQTETHASYKEDKTEDVESCCGVGCSEKKTVLQIKDSRNISTETKEVLRSQGMSNKQCTVCHNLCSPSSSESIETECLLLSLGQLKVSRDDGCSLCEFVVQVVLYFGLPDVDKELVNLTLYADGGCDIYLCQELGTIQIYSPIGKYDPFFENLLWRFLQRNGRFDGLIFVWW